jgi:all-trans-retinol 13,14-reductase
MNPTGKPLAQGSVAESYDAIVIGSGIGGLSAAALLSKHAGNRVLVLERHSVAGGFTHVFKRPGFEWDVGVHYIGGVNRPHSATRAGFDHVTEGRLQWSPMPEVYDQLKIGGRSYDLPAGRERFRDRMKGYFPGEARAIDRYLAAVQSTVRASMLYFAEKAVPRFLSIVGGALMRYPFLRHADRTTAQVLAGLTRNPDLAAVLTAQWGNYGLPPAQSSFAMHAIVVDHYLEGAGYPIGGASEIAAAIAPLIESAGGRIATRAEVSRILVDGRNRAVGVRLADGREIRAPVIISDAGAWTTLTGLLPAEVSQQLPIRGELERVGQSISHLCLYVGLTRGPGDPEFGAANLWVSPNSDHDGSFLRYAEDPSAPFPVLFISFPSAKDPTFDRRYPGSSTIEVVAPMPFERFQPWAASKKRQRPADYEAFKQSLAERLLGELYRNVPAAKGRVTHAELSTPLTTRHYDNGPRGEIYGLSAVPGRFRIRDLGARTAVRNLYLTGQDVGSCGIAGALAGGAIAASAVLRRNLVSLVFRPTRR